MSYQEDLILSIYGRGEPGLAMADPLPKGPDRDKPVQAPGKDGVPSSPYLPGKSPIPSKGLASVPNFPGGGFTTTSGAFVDLSGEAYYLEDGELIPEGGYDPAIHGDLIPQGGPDMRVMNNQDMMIAQGPELGGTGRLLTIGEYNQAVDTGFNNLMNSDMTPQDFEDYLRIKETAKRQMLDGM